jgi:peroxiredoxin
MRRIIKLISAGFILLCISAFTISKTTISEGYKVGDVTEDFSLKNIDGNKVSLSNYKNAKGFIIAFTCNTCPFAVAYEDRI